ncbi:calcium-binding protein [Streptomyces sp. HC44]|uniref:Calcium-binding protein n=2 Tax=Streptomyces scabichelini TaxID=2711217 RepID=A0A6G4V169_9ACTN|nr:calcium-binding protein [Streptomyces scabichelini]
MVVAAMAGSAVTLTAGSASAAAGSVTKSGDQVIVNAGARTGNDFKISLSGNQVVIRDDHPMSVGGGCRAEIPGNTVFCPVNPNSDTVVVNAGDGDDTITKTGSIRSELNAGPGNDRIDGGPTTFADYLDGGAGNDSLNGGPNLDILTGGLGADTLSGGGGFDYVNYQDSSSGVVVDLDNNADDGVSGEGDNALSNVELIIGSKFGDRLTGSTGNNSLLGLAGNDVLTGGAGNDSLYGDTGNDTLEARDNVSGNDTADGGANTDTCRADTSDAKNACEA